MNPVNMSNILTKVLADERVLRSRPEAGGGTARDRPEEVGVQSYEPTNRNSI